MQNSQTSLADHMVTLNLGLLCSASASCVTSKLSSASTGAPVSSAHSSVGCTQRSRVEAILHHCQHQVLALLTAAPQPRLCLTSVAAAAAARLSAQVPILVVEIKQQQSVHIS